MSRPDRARTVSPYCGTCGHESPHWIAAGQDVCEEPRGCNCEHYEPAFDHAPGGLPPMVRRRLDVGTIWDVLRRMVNRWSGEYHCCPSNKKSATHDPDCPLVAGVLLIGGLK